MCCVCWCALFQILEGGYSLCSPYKPAPQPRGSKSTRSASNSSTGTAASNAKSGKATGVPRQCTVPHRLAQSRTTHHTTQLAPLCRSLHHTSHHHITHHHITQHHHMHSHAIAHTRRKETWGARGDRQRRRADQSPHLRTKKTHTAKWFVHAQ